MKNKINALSNMLNKLGLKKEAGKVGQILKTSQQFSVEDWKAVIVEIDTPPDPQIMGRAINYVIDGGSNFASAVGKMKDDKAMIEEASQLAAKIGSKYMNEDTIKKLSSTKPKTAQLQWLKDLVSGPRGFGLTEESLTGKGKLIPYIGFIFSAAMALNNLYYGFIEYKKLVSKASELGISWRDSLNFMKLKELIPKFKEDPHKLKVLASTANSAKVFWDEAISIAANSLDAVKDFLLAPFNVAFFSLLVAADMSTSLLIGIAESSIEDSAKANYDPVLEEIRGIAEEKIKSLSYGEDLSPQEEEAFQRWLDS
jgi:hypothetical protein